MLHIGAEWTSLRDRTFPGRVWPAALTLTLAAASCSIAPLAFIGLVAAALLGQRLLEGFTARAAGNHRGGAGHHDSTSTQRIGCTVHLNLLVDPQVIG